MLAQAACRRSDWRTMFDERPGRGPAGESARCSSHKTAILSAWCQSVSLTQIHALSNPTELSTVVDSTPTWRRVARRHQSLLPATAAQPWASGWHQATSRSLYHSSRDEEDGNQQHGATREHYACSRHSNEKHRDCESSGVLLCLSYELR